MARPKKIPSAEVYDAYIVHGTYAEAAAALGLAPSAVAYHVKRHQVELKPFEVPKLPSRERSVEEIISHRKKEFARFNASEEARKLIQVRVKLKGPVAINLQGDPHMDDPGCDIEALERDTTLVRETEGFFAGCIGDLQNAWVGRLARLYAKQTITAKEAWKLVQWYIKSCPGKWLFVLKGNHDLWAGDNDLLGWIAAQEDVISEEHQARFALKFPNGREIRLSARHDWPGASMWNPTHGGARAARFTTHDHIIVSGHRHSGGYQKIYIEASDIVSHIIQLGAYKIHDDFRNERGFNRFQVSPSTTVVIDPDAQSQRSLIHAFDDTEEAAEFLKFKRRSMK
jgi:hypothetical protein